MLLFFNQPSRVPKMQNRPAFVDACWLFILAGASIITSMVLIPPADDLNLLQRQRNRLESQLNLERSRLIAYSEFIEALDDGDPTLVRRLAAAQLNLIPENADPVALIVESSDGLDASADDWIEQTLPGALETPDQPELNETAPPSVLRHLASGPLRLWTMLAGVVCIFVGLLPRTTGACDPDRAPTNDDSEMRIV